ncbi:MAG TPA: HAD family phosphatase [Thermodesulfobacteriota bacterium]|nr:HAD family phosphatase [Thermodesulfobacteriota bacterium]
MHMKAVIFDFDGVIADTEPIHLGAFQRTLEGLGIELTEEDYYANYLAYDDKTFFRRLLGDRDFKHGDELIPELMERKTAHYFDLIKGNIEILPGVREFLGRLVGRCRMAIGSGALRAEITDILDFAGIRGFFEVIVSAEDIERCKPAPDVYLEVLKRLNAAAPGLQPISPGECLVIEDSLSGIEAALSAGMKCLAVSNSYPAEELTRAHMVSESLTRVGVEDLAQLFP